MIWLALQRKEQTKQQMYKTPLSVHKKISRTKLEERRTVKKAFK